MFQPMEDEPGYWAVLRHADVMHVAEHPEIFSAHEGGVVIENLDPPSLTQMRDMLLAMDPPRHTAYRRRISPEFKARVIGAMEERIRTITTEILDRAEAPAEAAEGREVEFVHDVCAHLPSQVVGELMGLPQQDWPAIGAMAERNSGGQDPDIASAADRGSSSIDMAMYAVAFAAKRRNEPPQGDLTDLLLGTEFDNKSMTDIDFGRFFAQLVTARQRHYAHHVVERPARPSATSRPTGTVTRRPGTDTRRSRGDPALGQPVALLPSHRAHRHRT